MTRRPNWFGREFSFDLPLGIYPIIVERLRGTPARLEDRIRLLPVKTLTRRDRNTWSIQENAGHLLDLEPLGMDRLDDFAAGRLTLRAADLANRKTYEANHNASAIEELLLSFRAARRAFVERLEGFDQAFGLRTATHPRFKKEMRVVDLAFFIAEHDDHHLARITELIRLFESQITTGGSRGIKLQRAKPPQPCADGLSESVSKPPETCADGLSSPSG
jgi:hypothetical protein